MPMQPTDLTRPVKIDISACGAIELREQGQRLTSGFLPFFSVDTHEEAAELRERLCRRERDGSGTYRVNDRPTPGLAPEDALDELDELRDRWRAEYTGGGPRCEDCRPVDESEVE